MFLKDINSFIYSFEHNPVWVEQFFVFVLLFELHYITIIFFRILCCQTQFIAYNKVAQFAICKSFLVSVYVRPAVVLGSALVKMLLEGIISTSGTFGYLYECAGPCGCNKITLTLEFSTSLSRTYANYQFLL